ncbi:TonB-dependent siderophore receptor [Pseudoduganella albidiflava]|nr:TonB-dependent siderophore receptor [Pseudoduganella albidiflava]GGY56085.1 ligand-gated channel protein [Pseudoduganella albidiflava]
MYFPGRLRPSVQAVSVALLPLAVTCHAAAAGMSESAMTETPVQAVLPVVEVVGANREGFVTQTVSTTRSDKSLHETPQSITVLTRELLDARQATTLDEAIETVAGVASSTLGRRGWDDFIIRGQSAADTMYLDGLRIGQANWIAQEVFGAERIEVVKGPASVYFGQVTPGGTVNIVSKRPRAEAFTQLGITVGSDGYRQGTFDIGRPIASANGKAAVRIAGMAMNSDDPTDNVWFKNRYLAPSIALDFGTRTDFTILASLNQRQYVRQQGLPVAATSLTGRDSLVPQDFFTGDTTVAPYEAEQKAIGYALTHRFDSGWTLNQTYRHTDMELAGQLANTSGALTAAGNFNRNVLSQDFNGRSDALDTSVSRTMRWGGLAHNVMAGFDALHDRLYRDSRRCAIAAQNIYTPVQGRPVTNCNVTSIVDTTLAQRGAYLRDYIDVTEKLGVSLSLRHDRAKLKTVDVPTGARTDVDSSANTGHAGIVYKATPNIAPYASYATSFLPQTGITADGAAIDPEEGRQAEVGAKFVSDDRRLSASVAYYDLKRRNLAQADDLNPGFQVAIGAQRTRGYEAEIAADLKNGWQLSAALSILDAAITEAAGSQAATVGQKLSGVPRKTANLLANYRFSGALRGWGAGAGVRHVGEKTSTTSVYVTPGYTVADANLSYAGRGWRVQLNVKNLFDREYFAGAANANWVPVGNPRTAMLKTVVDF